MGNFKDSKVSYTCILGSEQIRKITIFLHKFKLYVLETLNFLNKIF
jgi:hypothetical protein